MARGRGWRVMSGWQARERGSVGGCRVPGGVGSDPTGFGVPTSRGLDPQPGIWAGGRALRCLLAGFVGPGNR